MKKFKTDWEEALARLTAWWAGEKTDRVVALVTAPREGVSPRPINKKVPDMYINPEVVFANLEASLEATFWGGESLPNHWVYLGPVPLSGYLGCEMHFQENTVWHTPCFSSLKEHNKLRFTPENKWYQLLCGLTRASVQRSRGQYLVSGQGFGAASDVMADLWGAEKILVATVEEPGVVKKIVRQLTDISCKLYDELDALVAPFQTGSFDWLRLWAPGRMWTIQSDISCMLSPKIFSELILPELIRETEHVDFCFYHLDGPGAIKHLDSLL
ncbi:MAG TPA: hypothetical protein PK644_03505, partial [bacterium]|nr:hypothetical protein [bacterium]